MKFRTKQVVKEAIQWDARDKFTSFHRLIKMAGVSGPFYLDDIDEVEPSGLTIETLEGDMHVSDKDWIIKGVNGEFYPCRPDIFEKTYEPINETIPPGDEL